VRLSHRLDALEVRLTGLEAGLDWLVATAGTSLNGARGHGGDPARPLAVQSGSPPSPRVLASLAGPFSLLLVGVVAIVLGVVIGIALN
jgi:hypothetical protein